MSEPDPYRFPGFASPNYTQIPDDFFDALMPHLSEAELRVCLYVMRRTFGFKKASDAISISQMVNGITTREGVVLDYGCGLKRTAVKRGVAGLVEKGVLRVTKQQADNGEYETNIYSLVVRDGVGHETTHPRSPSDLPVGRKTTLQETETQQTDQTRSFEISKGPQFIFDEDRNAISTVMRDFARELGDTAPLPSTVSRAVNLYRQSGWALDPFLDALYEARRITQERTASIKTASPQKLGPKPKVPYFFSVVESLITGAQRREG